MFSCPFYAKKKKKKEKKKEKKKKEKRKKERKEKEKEKSVLIKKKGRPEVFFFGQVAVYLLKPSALFAKACIYYL